MDTSGLGQLLGSRGDGDDNGGLVLLRLHATPHTVLGKDSTKSTVTTAKTTGASPISLLTTCSIK